MIVTITIVVSTFPSISVPMIQMVSTSVPIVDPSEVYSIHPVRGFNVHVPAFPVPVTLVPPKMKSPATGEISLMIKH